MGLESMALGDAYVNIMGETNQLAASFARARMMTAGLVTGLGKTIVGGIGAAFLAAGGTVAASFKSWMDEERGMARMSNVFESVGMNAGKMSDKIENLASSLMRQTTMTDNSVRAMAAQAAQMGVGEKNIEGFIKAAVGLGAQAGMDPENMMRPLVRASQGYMRNLLRLFPQIDKTASKQSQFNQIMQIAAQGMRIAAKETNTLWGAFKQLRNAFGETLDSLGKGLFEKSGLNKEIKKVTASVFAIVDALDRGFSTKAFKGFNFEGLGDWIAKLLIRFTAMLMTIPEVFHAIKDIFSDPMKFLSVLGDGMIAIGKTLLRTLLDGFGAMSGLFAALGKTLYHSLAEELNKIDAFKSLFKGHFEAQRKSRLETMGEEDLGALFRETMMARFSGTEYQKQEAMSAMTGAFQYTDEKKGSQWVMPSRESMIDTLSKETGEVIERAISGREVKSALSVAYDNLKDVGKKAGTDLMVELKTIWEGISAMTDADPAAKFAEFLKRITALYNGEKLAAGIGKPGEIDMDGGVADKASFSIISMSDQWKKMQEGITKNKDEKEVREATKKTASWTEQTAKGVAILINKFDEDDSSTPLFAAGY